MTSTQIWSREKMRIAIYKDTLANKRGADVAVLALADGLKERGFEVEVFERTRFAEKIAEPWDVMVSTGTNEILDLAEAFPEKFPWPVVQQFHTNPKSQFKWKKFRRNYKVRKALRRVDVIQVLSAEFIPQVAKYGAKVEVIGNWSKYAAVREAQPAEKVIIYPAAFQTVKRQDLLIKAFSKVAGDFPEWRVRLLGSDKTKHADKCRKLVAKLGLSDRVAFCGFVTNLDEEYGKCAFVGFPSFAEGFGLVLADAAMFRRPALLVHDWIGSAAVGGALVTKPTVADYAEGLRRLMADAALCRKMGDAACSFCEAAYSRGKILDAWQSLLNGLKA